MRAASRLFSQIPSIWLAGGINSVPNSIVNEKTQTSKLSDYTESRVSLQSTTQYLHDNETGAGYGLNVKQDGLKLAQGISQKAQVEHGTALKLVVKGQS